MKFDISSLSKKQKLALMGGGGFILVALVVVLFATKGPDLPSDVPPAFTAAQQLAEAQSKLERESPVLRDTTQQGNAPSTLRRPDFDAMADAAAIPSAASVFTPIDGNQGSSPPIRLPTKIEHESVSATGTIAVDAATKLAVDSGTPIAAVQPTPEVLPAATVAPARPGEASKPPAQPEQAAGDIAGRKAKQIAANYDAYYTSLANLHRQTRVLELQKGIAELQSGITDLANKDKAREATRPGSVITAFPPPMRPSRPTDSSTVDSIFVPSSAGSHSDGDSKKGQEELQLVSTMMVAGEYEAIVLSGGASAPFRVGMTVDDGWLVSDIARSAVTLKRKGKVKTLRIGD